VEWDVLYYDKLQNTVGGGKPKMKWHFTNTAKAWPSSKLGAPPADEAAQSALVDQLQDRKTEIYKKIVVEVAEARPGVLQLMDEVLERPDIAKVSIEWSLACRALLGATYGSFGKCSMSCSTPQLLPTATAPHSVMPLLPILHT
jgi:hypothetical protein